MLLSDIQVTNLSCIPDTTPNNPFDDDYTFDLAVIGGSTGWKAEIANSTISGTYGATLNIGPFNITDGPLFLIVYDSISQSCNN